MSPPPMDCPIGNSIFFCSISRGNRILYSHCVDLDLEALAAAAAVEGAPPFHSRYSHTAGDRTFAFLIDDDGHTFFVIADSSGGSAAAFRFLELMRDSFHRASKNGVHEEFIPFVRRLIASLETLSRSGGGEKARGEAEEIWIDMPVRPAGSVPFQGSLSPRVWMQQNGRRLWWRHVKIVAAVDLLLCLVLFGIWLAVCRGFRCIA